MRAPAASMTSKTSSLKALLLRAWRERWNDLQWSIHIKTILPRGVSGDVYNLADCILQQALVGRGPNQLVISYLMHSLSSQLVSYAAVLQSISKYDGFHKSHCVVTLLEFLETIESGITCRGKPEEGLLAASVLSIVQWLLTCLIYGIKNPLVIKEHPEILDLPVKILNNMVSNDFTVAMLYLAKHEARETYQEVVKKAQEIELILPKSATQPAKSVAETLTKICKLDMESFPNQNETTEPLTYLLQPLLAVEVLLNPSTETSTFVNQLLMVQRLKNYCNTRLYSEIMRACLTSLNDVLGTNKESQWGAFMFLKVPHILKQLHLSKNEGVGDKMEFSQEVVDSFDYLLQYTPLLDIMDAKCSCSCVECLLNELQKVSLVTETQVKAIVAKREATTQAVQKLDSAATAAGLNAQGQNASIPKVIIRAEPTLARILKTLDADYLKIQEALLSVLGQVLTGKSFELILAVATVEGKLRSFVSKLIKFNECSKQVGGEVGKAAVTRAMLFDTSFLMLCSIVHTYGSQVVLAEGRGDSFFERWVRDSMVERGRPKSPDAALVGADPVKVDALLAQFNGPDGADFKTSQAKWQEICLHIPATIKEVLLAWEHGAIQATDVKRILDAMRSRMCCLPVCAAAWLCSYMQILHQDALLKPMNMVQQFLTPPTAAGLATPAAIGAEETTTSTTTTTTGGAGAIVPPAAAATAQDNFKERAGLMHVIVRKMQYDVRPPCRTKGGAMSHCVISAEPISEQLATAWTEIQARGWVTVDATQLLERLLNTGGAQWFVDTIVRELMRLRYRAELDRAVDLAFAVFHLDIEQCTLALLGHTLPYYLNDKLASEELVEPQASALARLSAYGAYGALEAQRGSAAAAAGRKRGRSVDDGADLGTPAKLMRLAHGLAESTDAPLFPSPPSPTDSAPTPALRVREPLEGALTRLYAALAVIAGRDGEVSQQTHFICRLVQCLLRCGMDDTRRLVVQGLPTTLVPSLLRSLPELFSTGLLLRLYDLESVGGRRATSRDLCLLRNLELKQRDCGKSQPLFAA